MIGAAAATVGGIQYLNTDYASEAGGSAGLIPLIVGTTVFSGGMLATPRSNSLGKKHATHVQAAAEMTAAQNA